MARDRVLLEIMPFDGDTERLGSRECAELVHGARAQAEESAQAYQRIRSNFEVVDYVNIGFAVAGLLLAGALLATIPASITRPLDSLIESADKMSLGDLGKKFEAGGVKDF